MPQIIIEILNLLTTSLGPESPIQKILADFSSPDHPPTHREIVGSWGSFPRLLAAILNRSLRRPLLLITPHVSESYAAQDDIETFASLPADLFPAAESSIAQSDPTSEIACERLKLYRRDPSQFTPDTIIVAPIPALMQPVPAKASRLANVLTLSVGLSFATKNKKISGPEALAQWLIDHHFNRTEQVDTLGDFAVRGGIVDVFPPDQDQPIRVEFFGDDIDSIRFFDLDNLRSLTAIDRITLNAALAQPADMTASFLDDLPKNTLIVVEEFPDIINIGNIFLDRSDNPDSLFPVNDVVKRLAAFDTLFINHFQSDQTETPLALPAQSVQRFENNSRLALRELADLADQDQHIFFFCEKPAEKQRLREIFAADCPDRPFPDRFHIPVGFIHRGFAIPSANIVVTSHHEVFGQHFQPRRFRKDKTPHAIDTFNDIEINDLVVHVNHGVGKFLGVKTIEKNGADREFIALEYADKVVINVPADKIHLVHKYVGCHTGSVKLNRVGSTVWQKQKQKIADALEGLAQEFIDIQAFRNTTPGVSFPADTPWQKEFEQLFPYPPTEDQLTASSEIKNDMQRSRPMDRLLCGDVGYGKTELAIRAVFKAVEFGKQVAVLVPTTVLAEQHYRTFTERLADFPFTIEVLSRFKTPSHAARIIAKTKCGHVDVLIGTHRILSHDVDFKDLGLVIIDEEQRFGVEHKERLKSFRKTVDILTMTATPIPRTLHMALLGIRDISSLATPPLDRRSIVTQVCPYNERHIREAILREIARDGQIYFLHNRVHNIFAVRDKIQAAVPEARIIVAHGQMPRHELEQAMLKFVCREADILVCTTIIESGLDIPNANTIFVNDADRFGLAELHQLRGRVGRFKNRAFAFMLLPARRSINPIAAKRLKAIEEYSQLGSGFRIAMRDLEIRGAGNILGVQQSGHINIIGYELYCQLLASAVRKIQGKPDPTPTITQLDLDIDANIPRSYIPSDRQRMDVYRRLASCAAAEELDQLNRDLLDGFGKLPPAVEDLLQLTEIRLLASRWNIKTITQEPPHLIFSADKLPALDPLFKKAKDKTTLLDNHTIYYKLSPAAFDSPRTLLAILRKLLSPTP